MRNLEVRDNEVHYVLKDLKNLNTISLSGRKNIKQGCKLLSNRILELLTETYENLKNIELSNIITFDEESN